ncbi:CFEM domain-containing protein [Cordyceps javanica]|uniref:CFEM domain-containing protein n=1 Tax=Cordyceps javanica TaxID=43265 RepID=A0A545UKY6_9HYPO|nr:CFEM domain-containing protein [Cordyceps javanica]
MTETACKTPARDDSGRFLIMVGLVVTAAGAMLITRLAYKRFFSVRGYLDSADWIILAATLVCLPSIAVNVKMALNGLGQDVWGVPPHELITFGLYFYVIQILYPILMGLIKISLTLFYLTLFPDRPIRLLLWGTVVFHILFTVVCVFCIIFQCLPLSYQMTKYDVREPRLVDARCMDINASGWVNAALTLASDVWLLGIPICQIRKLRLHWKKKIAATVTIVSVSRLRALRHYANTSNPTWDQFDLVWFSTIEVGIGLMCTCMPATRLALEHMAPRIFGNGSREVSVHSNRLSSISCHDQSAFTDTRADMVTMSSHTKPLPRLPCGEAVDG